ncbi:signal peptidase I [Streptococcus sp. DD13]|uniref:signal peptidase I n=1 Tax=Streptococcus sp. DD13 TaxID=1777881 RepID=UPI0007983A30|nr:signal peptidase I [Streptococcus sp. DD13]KXT77972.1 Signal peptidase I [Streptococcus sp. DD13]
MSTSTENENLFLRLLREWGVFALVILIFYLSLWLFWSPVTVDGHSMDPTLADGDRLIMLKTTGIQRFDVVVAKEKEAGSSKEKLIVKRVIGMPGDTIEYKDDVLYVNGQQTDEPYLKEYLDAFQNDKLQTIYGQSGSRSKQFQTIAAAASHFTLSSVTTDQDGKPTGSSTFKVEVPEGQYFLLGDNRLVSLDSRSQSVGTFSREEILGEVKFRFWPFNHVGSIS